MSEVVKIKGYDVFRCIANECTLTCCQEWRIAVDEETKEKWKDIDDIDLSLLKHIEDDGSGYKIKLNASKKCPLLDHNKLCRIVTQHGETYLSDTCTSFPRIQQTIGGRLEHTLDTGCPAVIDILHNHIVDALEWENEQTIPKDLLYHVREAIIGVMAQDEYTLEERMMSSFFMLLEILEKEGLSNQDIASYSSQEQIKQVVQAIHKMRFRAIDCLFESNELFLDVVHNYRKQKLYVPHLEAIAQLAEKLETRYTDKELLEKQAIFRKSYKAYEKLIEKYLIAEIMSNMWTEESDLSDMVIQFQWTALVFVTCRHMLFLNWLNTNEKAIQYESLRDTLSVVSRVTGYEQADIKEYLSNSFEELIWEWGYLALIVGHDK